MQFYEPNWKHKNHQCKKCKWEGEAISAVLGKSYGEILEILCPQCDEHIAVVLVQNVSHYYRNQNEIILDTEPSYQGNSLKDGRATEKWEQYIVDFEASVDRTSYKVFDKYFYDELIDSSMKVLYWSILGKRVGSLRGKVSSGGKTLAIFPMQYGDFNFFLLVASILFDQGITDIIPTELAFSVMCGEDKLAYRKINLARTALQYAPYWETR